MRRRGLLSSSIAQHWSSFRRTESQFLTAPSDSSPSAYFPAARNRTQTGDPTFNLLAGRRQLAGRRVHLENNDVVGVLVGGEQVAAGRVDGEVARRLVPAWERARPRSAFRSLGSTRNTAMLSWPRFDP